MAYKFVGYFSNWAQYRQGGGKFSPNQVNASLFTHINFAFVMLGFESWSVDPSPDRTGEQRYTGDYTIQPVEWNDQKELYPAIQSLKQKNGALKTLLSVGGWSFNTCDDTPESAGTAYPYGPFTCQLFSKMAADSGSRAQFIKSSIDYAKKYGFDGIDLDWEYPAEPERGGRLEDYTNFLALLREFRQAAGSGFLLTIASPAVPKGGKSGDTFFQWLSECAQYLDWFNVMSYDYHGAFDNSGTVGTGANAPLLKDSEPGGTFFIKETVEAYLKANIPSEKIVLGLATYGRSYTVKGDADGFGKPFSSAGPAGEATQTPGVLAYFEIVKRLSNGELDVKEWDEPTLTPYAYSTSTGLWVTYDNTKSLSYKVSYLIQEELGGAMVWAIDMDDFSQGSPLMSKIKETLDNPSSAPALPESESESKPEKPPEPEEPDDSDEPWSEILGVFPEAWLEGSQRSESQQLASRAASDDVSDFYLPIQRSAISLVHLLWQPTTVSSTAFTKDERMTVGYGIAASMVQIGLKTKNFQTTGLLGHPQLQNTTVSSTAFMKAKEIAAGCGSVALMVKSGLKTKNFPITAQVPKERDFLGPRSLFTTACFTAFMKAKGMHRAGWTGCGIAPLMVKNGPKIRSFQTMELPVAPV